MRNDFLELKIRILSANKNKTFSREERKGRKENLFFVLTLRVFCVLRG